MSIGALTCGVALAQEGGDASSIVEAEGVPRVLVVGFEDADDEDCNPRFSRYGRCVEEVRFVDMDPAWSADIDADGVTRAQWRNTGRLYAEIWEDMAHRWNIDADVIANALKAKGVFRFPAAKQQWQATDRDPEGGDRRIYSLPRSSSWLNESLWVDGRVNKPMRDLTASELIASSPAFFPIVRVLKAPGLVDSPPMVVIRGRFALRLAADGRRHPYDIMDGDPEASAPFFEQMYPYSRGLSQDDSAVDDDGEVPLMHFVVDEALKHDGATNVVGIRSQNFRRSLLPEVDPYDAMVDYAHREFSLFYTLVGSQILRFAREEFTPTHLRVLTALMAMESPPGKGDGALLAADGLNPGGSGETDLVDTSINSFVGPGSRRDFRINFVELPSVLIEKHITMRPEWNNPSDEFKMELLRSILNNLEDNLRDGIRFNLDAFVFRDLDDAAIENWVQNNAMPGRADVVKRYFKRVALDLLVSRLDDETRERVQTDILRDHINLRITNGFGGANAPKAAPAALQERTQGQWESVLSTHGMAPDAIPDKPGAVNPIAICSTKERLAALDEPVFGKVDVDQLVIASGRLTSMEELLMDVREQLPFIMMDDPLKNEPDVTRLVGLPGDRAIYRIRWQVWSGWHFLWGVEPLAEDDPTGARRIALRTAAICDDMVLAAPELVPTLARAALLDGQFRPAVPVRNTGKAKRKRKAKSSDKAVTDSQMAVQRGRGAKSTADAVTSATPSASSLVGTSGTVIGGLGTMLGGGKAQRRGVDTTPINSEVVQYVRGLMRDPVRRLVGEKPIVLTVFDHGSPADRQRVWDSRPRTPYLQHQTRAGKGTHVRSAAWALQVERPGGDVSARMVAPAYLPTEILSTPELKQVWKRRVATEWIFGGGLGFFPFRQVNYGCFDDAALPEGGAASSAPCALQEPGFEPVRSQGISLDLNAIHTFWLINDRRFGIEFGPETRIDFLPPGRNPFFEGDNFMTMIHWQVGIIAGFRYAPDPHPVWRRRSRRFPWGAPLPDGTSNLSRVQFGTRFGFLIGPSWAGLEGTGLAEMWLGWSVRGKDGPQSTFTPYRPNVLMGPFARIMMGFPLAPNIERDLKLNYSLTAVVGLRAAFRLAGKPQLEMEVPE